MEKLCVCLVVSVEFKTFFFFVKKRSELAFSIVLRVTMISTLPRSPVSFPGTIMDAEKRQFVNVY